MIIKDFLIHLVTILTIFQTMFDHFNNISDHFSSFSDCFNSISDCFNSISDCKCWCCLGSGVCQCCFSGFQTCCHTNNLKCNRWKYFELQGWISKRMCHYCWEIKHKVVFICFSYLPLRLVSKPSWWAPTVMYHWFFPKPVPKFWNICIFCQILLFD